jgi:hypothetical protein
MWIDVFGADEQWGPPAKRTIARCLNEGGLFINPIIYAEVSNRFNSIGELDAVLPAQVVERETLPYTAVLPGGQGVPAVQEVRRNEAHTASGSLYRCARHGPRAPAAHS